MLLISLRVHCARNRNQIRSILSTRHQPSLYTHLFKAVWRATTNKNTLKRKSIHETCAKTETTTTTKITVKFTKEN